MIAFVVLWFTCSYYFHDFKIRFFSHTFWMCIALAWTLLVLHWMVVFCGLQVLLAKLQLCAWRGWETRWRNATSVRSTCKLFHLTLVSFRLMSEKQRHQTVGTCYCACVTHMEITMLVWHAWRSLCLCDTHGDYYACVTCIMYGASLGWQSFFKITEKLRRLPPHSPPPQQMYSYHFERFQSCDYFALLFIWVITRACVWLQEIHKKIISLDFRDCHAKIRQVDSQPTVGHGVVIQVSLASSSYGVDITECSEYHNCCF